MIPDGSEHQPLNYGLPSNIDIEATKSSSRKVQYSNNKGIPRREAAGAGIYRL